MQENFKFDLEQLERLLYTDDIIKNGYTDSDFILAEKNIGRLLPQTLKAVYEVLGIDSILTRGFYSPINIRIVNEPREYNGNSVEDYIGFEFADLDGVKIAYFTDRRRDSDYKCYERIDYKTRRDNRFWGKSCQRNYRFPPYSDFLEFFAEVALSNMKYIITFSNQKLLSNYQEICQDLGATSFSSYFPFVHRGNIEKNLLYSSEKHYIVMFDERTVPKLVIGSNLIESIYEIDRFVKVKWIRNNGKKVIDRKYYYKESIPTDFQGRLKLIMSIILGNKTAVKNCIKGRRTDQSSMDNVPDELVHFIAQIESNKALCKSRFNIILSCENLINEPHITIAAEEQGVCEYFYDTRTCAVYFKSEVTCEQVPMSIGEFLLYLLAIQSTEVLRAQGYISKDSLLGLFMGKIAMPEVNIYIHSKRRMIAIDEGDKILVMAHTIKTLQQFEEQCGIEVQYL